MAQLALPLAQHALPLAQHALPLAQHALPLAQHALPLAQLAKLLWQLALPWAQPALTTAQHAKTALPAKPVVFAGIGIFLYALWKKMLYEVQGSVTIVSVPGGSVCVHKYLKAISKVVKLFQIGKILDGFFYEPGHRFFMATSLRRTLVRLDILLSFSHMIYYSGESPKG